MAEFDEYMLVPTASISINSSTSSQSVDVTNYATANVSAISVSSLDNSIIKSCVMNPTSASGDEDTARVTVQIPAGYHDNTTVTKDFTDLLPGLDVPGGAAQALNTYEYYDATGNKITGTMANNGAVSYIISSQNGTYTIPAGYHNGSGIITANINTGSATTPATTIAQSQPTFSKSGDVITASVAQKTQSVTPTVSAGYVSSGTSGTITLSSNSNTYTIQTETKTATANGTVTPTSGKYLSSVTVAIPVYDGSVS